MDTSKVYLVDGQRMKLKDLTLKESDRVNKIIARDFTTRDNAIVGQWTLASLTEFLGIILEPADGDGKEIDFGNVTERTAAEIVRDFFFVRLRMMSGDDGFSGGSVSESASSPAD